MAQFLAESFKSSAVLASTFVSAFFSRLRMRYLRFFIIHVYPARPTLPRFVLYRFEKGVIPSLGQWIPCRYVEYPEIIPQCYLHHGSSFLWPGSGRERCLYSYRRLRFRKSLSAPKVHT